MDGLRQCHKAVFIQHQLLQLATPKRHTPPEIYITSNTYVVTKYQYIPLYFVLNNEPAFKEKHASYRIGKWATKSLALQSENDTSLTGGSAITAPSIIMFVRLLPAQSLGDKFQVVVSCHELREAGQFANAWRNPIKVQLVRVYVQFFQFGQLTDRRLDKDTQANIKHWTGLIIPGYPRFWDIPLSGCCHHPDRISYTLTLQPIQLYNSSQFAKKKKWLSQITK